MSVFVTMYDHSWGRGETAEESKAQARSAGGRGNKWITFRLPEGAELESACVDDFGNICWKGPSGKLEAVIKGRGVKASK